MSNIIIGILITAVTFFLATYGVFFGYEKLQENATRQIVLGATERMLIHINAVAEQMGGRPLTADLDEFVITREQKNGMQIFYTPLTATTAYLCIRVTAPTAAYRNAAYQKVAQMYGGLHGGSCNTNTGPNATVVSVTIPLTF